MTDASGSRACPGSGSQTRACVLHRLSKSESTSLFLGDFELSQLMTNLQSGA
jgi:hypothetical protein